MIEAYLDVKKPASAEALTISRKEWGDFLDYAEENRDKYIDGVWKGNTVSNSTVDTTKITAEDVENLRSIGRKSVSEFTSEDIKKAEPFARRYYKEMGVKSPFFRAWFGDWREFDVSKSPFVLNIAKKEFNNSAEGASFVKNGTKNHEFFRGNAVNKDTGFTVNIGMQVYDDTLTYANRSFSRNGNKEMYSARLSLLQNVKDIVENSVLLETSTLKDDEKNPNRVFTHVMYSVATVENKNYLVKLKIDEFDTGESLTRRAYNLNNIEISPVAVSQVLSPASTTSDSGGKLHAVSISDLFGLVKTFDKEFRYNSVNPALLNEDGTPKVVYHGTDAEFEAFDPTKGRANMDIQGMFFSPWEIDAAGYGSKVGAYYINLRNPADEGTAYKALNMFKGQNNAGVKARDYLIKQGYDGVNNSDEEYIAFYPEQVKSATDNIGTFDGEDKRYKYSTVDTTKITPDMSDEERTEVLNNKSIIAPEYNGEADSAIEANAENLRSEKIGLVKKAIVSISEQFDIVGKNISIEDVGVEITLSKSNLKESISKKATPEELVKLLPVLEDSVSHAIGIERHDNRYYFDSDTVYFENLLGGFTEGEYFVPVRFGLKHSKTGNATLYVVVNQNKIAISDIEQKKETEVVKTAGPNETNQTASRSVNYSISQIVPFVKNKDLLRYLPDNMLDAEQKNAKWEAIAETIKATSEKNDRKYAEYIASGNLEAANEFRKNKSIRNAALENFSVVLHTNFSKTLASITVDKCELRVYNINRSRKTVLTRSQPILRKYKRQMPKEKFKMNTTATDEYQIMSDNAIDEIELYGISYRGEVLETDIFDDYNEARAFVDFINSAHLEKGRLTEMLCEYFDSPKRFFLHWA